MSDETKQDQAPSEPYAEVLAHNLKLARQQRDDARSRLATIEAERDRAAEALGRVIVVSDDDGLSYGDKVAAMRAVAAGAQVYIPMPNHVLAAGISASIPTPNGTPGLDRATIEACARACEKSYRTMERDVGCFNGEAAATEARRWAAKCIRALTTPPIPEKERNSGSLPSQHLPAEGEQKQTSVEAPRTAAHRFESGYGDCPGTDPKANGHSFSCNELTAAIEEREKIFRALVKRLLARSKHSAACLCVTCEDAALALREGQEGKVPESDSAPATPPILGPGEAPRAAGCRECKGTGSKMVGEGMTASFVPCKACRPAAPETKGGRR